MHMLQLLHVYVYDYRNIILYVCVPKDDGLTVDLTVPTLCDLVCSVYNRCVYVWHGKITYTTTICIVLYLLWLLQITNLLACNYMYKISPQ